MHAHMHAYIQVFRQCGVIEKIIIFVKQNKTHALVQFASHNTAVKAMNMFQGKVCVHVFVCMYVCMYVCIYIYVYKYMYVCLLVYVWCSLHRITMP